MSETIKYTRRSAVAQALALVAMAGLPFQIHAKEVVRIAVPFPPGGSADAMGRILAERLKNVLNTSVIVENKPGASTRVAAEYVKNSKADGNVYLLTLMDTMVLAPLIYEHLRYDPQKDFSPVTKVSGLTYGIAVNAASPYRNMQDFLNASRKNETQASLGISGLGQVLHFMAVKLKEESKIDFSIIPFQGGAVMVSNLIGNQITACVEGVGGLKEQHLAGKIRILGISGETRNPELPDVATFREQGLDSLTVESNYSLYAPAKTDKKHIDKMNAAMKEVLAMKDVKDKLTKIGYNPLDASSPEEVTQNLKALSAKWAPVVKASGFRGE